MDKVDDCETFQVKASETGRLFHYGAARCFGIDKFTNLVNAIWYYYNHTLDDGDDETASKALSNFFKRPARYVGKDVGNGVKIIVGGVLVLELFPWNTSALPYQFKCTEYYRVARMQLCSDFQHEKLGKDSYSTTWTFNELPTEEKQISCDQVWHNFTTCLYPIIGS
jgi:hypothetical protein